MKKKLPVNSGYIVLNQIKENLQLVIVNEKKYIIKGKRKDERNVFEKLRFINEKRIYKALDKAKLKSLKFPSYSLDPVTGNLILDYIDKSELFTVTIEQYIAAYFELQRIKPRKKILLDIYNQIFGGYFYRTYIVTIATLTQKLNFKTVIKILSIFIQLNFKHKALTRKYWIHGDLTHRNYFNDENGDLFFIDFENMFYTEKWFLSEIVGRSFNYNYEMNKINFSIKALCMYLTKVANETPDEKFCLYNQVRFGVLQFAVLQIAQSKIDLKRESYKELLLITINKKSFKDWYERNIKCYLELQTTN